MKIEIVKEMTTYKEVEKTFVLSVGKIVIRVSKWWKNSDVEGYDNDEKILDEDNYKKLSAKEKAEFDEFILELE